MNRPHCGDIVSKFGGNCARMAGLTARKQSTSFVLRLQQLRGRPGGLIKDNGELKILRERRPRKRRLESEFAFFQSLSRLLQLINFVKCGRTLFEPNSLKPYLNSERGRKFSRRLFTSPIKREIRHFPVVVLLWRQRNVQKSVTLLFCLFNKLLFWRFRCRRRRGITSTATSTTAVVHGCGVLGRVRHRSPSNCPNRARLSLVIEPNRTKKIPVRVW